MSDYKNTRDPRAFSDKVTPDTDVSLMNQQFNVMFKL